MKFDNRDLVHIANAVKPHGLNGHISLKLNPGYSEDDIMNGKPVFLFIEGLPVPFFPEECKRAGEYIAVKLKNVENSDVADRYRSCKVYSFELEKSVDNEDSDSFSLIGYAVYDKNFGFIGNITDFNNIPGNPVFETQLDNKTIIIPYNEDFIIKINKDLRSIEIETPEGLIDIYLK